jgi:hypothetical protein
MQAIIECVAIEVQLLDSGKILKLKSGRDSSRHGMIPLETKACTVSELYAALSQFFCFQE